MTFSYETSARSSASPEVVFGLLADAPGWAHWGGFVVGTAEWEREGSPPPGGVGAIRRMGRKPAVGREEIVEYDPPHHMAYIVLSGLPSRDYRADIDLYPDAGGTLIRWRGTFTPVVPGTGTVMAALLRRLIGSFASRAAEEAERRNPD